MNRNLPQFPLPAGPVVLRGRRASVFLPQRVVKLDFRGLPVARLLEACDGATPYRDIRSQLAGHTSPANLDRFVASLVQAGVLIDAARAAHMALRHAENPSRLGGPPPEAEIAAELPRQAQRRARRRVAARYLQPPRFGLRALIEKRRSVRDFADRQVALARMVALLWAANGCVASRAGNVRTIRRTVPSAGAIYPLTVGLINLRSVPGLARGIYLAHFRHDGGVGLKKVAGDASQSARAFIDPAPLERAQGAIVVFGDLALNAAKYRNRSALLVPLEAGHAVQSALLAAVELGVGAVEICGFFEERVRSLFGADERLVPLSTVIFGAPAGGTARTRGMARASFDFEWFEPPAEGYAPGFHIGSTRVAMAGKRTQMCWGRAQEPLLAWRKANAEAIERLACRLPQRLFEARISELPNALEPRELVAYDEQQYRSRWFPYRRFDPARRYYWSEGRDLLSDRPRAALAEFVYFRDALPRNARTHAYTSATTSGVAAFPTWEGALGRAALELFERDAFMRAWLFGETGAAVRPKSLTAAMAARVARLRAAGVKTVLQILRTEPACVCLVFAQDERRAFTKATASAALGAEDAIDHALQELEAQVALHPHIAAHNLSPEAVRSPSDHARLYAQRRYFRRADWLGRPRSTIDLRAVRTRRGRELDVVAAWARKTGHALVWFELRRDTAGLPDIGKELKVVRALVPGLIPISFGHGTEPWVPGTPERPRTRFPHPFA